MDEKTIDMKGYKDLLLIVNTGISLLRRNTTAPIEEISDGYHTFGELYEKKLLYNAALFNAWAEFGLYKVQKAKRHFDGGYPFNSKDWFIVVAELPTGQISNHYEMKHWDLFHIPSFEKSQVQWDGHNDLVASERLKSFINNKNTENEFK